jgi:hypothetical protein
MQFGMASQAEDALEGHFLLGFGIMKILALS